METVTLQQKHTHAGQDYAAGDSITVTEAEAAWLRARGVVGAAPFTAGAAAGEHDEEQPHA